MAVPLFEQLTGSKLYAAKAYAFSTHADKVKACDLDFLVAMSKKGHAIAQTNLAFCYDNGHGVSQDYAEAARWYRLAADQGFEAAQQKLLKLQ